MRDCRYRKLSSTWVTKPRGATRRNAASTFSSAHAGRRLIQRGAGLIEAKLRVAVIEFADHLALFDEIADVHRRGDDAPGNQRRDVAGLVGDERAGLLETRRDGPINGPFRPMSAWSAHPWN